MKTLKDPVFEEPWGMNYPPRFTDEFKELIGSAIEVILPFSEKEVSGTTTYFKVNGEEVNDYDCCDDQKCIDAAKKEIREIYVEGTHIEEMYTDNDGDHERIEICSVCGKPLNEWLTWCNSELECIEEDKPWTAEFLKEEGFKIRCILDSCPTMDCDISQYDKHKGGDFLVNALAYREAFFQRIGELAKSVIELNKNVIEL